VKAGHTFMGWFYDGKEYTSATVYKFEQGITLKAKWSENASATVDNGKGLSVTGKFPASSTLSANASNTNGSTYKAINSECKDRTGSDSNCILVTLKGDGVSKELPLTVKVKANQGYDGKEVKVFYYLDKVIETTGKVKDGYLTFEAYGNTFSGGVQITFGVQKGVMSEGSW